MKVCVYCKVEKPLDKFCVDHRVRSGYRNYCRACDSARRYRNKLVAKTKDPVLFALNQRKVWLKGRFGVTPEWFDRLLAVQGGGCAICGTDVPGGTGAFHVDHCHTTGTVRRLLCSNCNTGLGLFRDNPDLLSSATNYLLEFQTS